MFILTIDSIIMFNVKGITGCERDKSPNSEVAGHSLLVYFGSLFWFRSVRSAKT